MAPRRRAADEAPENRNAPLDETRDDLAFDGPAGLERERQGGGVLVVGHERAPGIDPRGGHVRFFERGGNDAAADDLADRRDRIERSRRGLSQDRDCRQHGPEVLEIARDEGCERGRPFSRGEHVHQIEVPGENAIDAGVHSVRPALRVGGQGEELIGCP